MVRGRARESPGRRVETPGRPGTSRHVLAPPRQLVQGPSPGLTGAKDGLNAEARPGRRKASPSRKAIPASKETPHAHADPGGCTHSRPRSRCDRDGGDGHVPFSRDPRGGGERRLAEWESKRGPDQLEDAPAPAHVGKRIVEGLFDLRLPPTRARLVNNVMHWGYGIANGGQYGLLAGSLPEPRIRYGLPFGASVWPRLRDPACGQALRADLEVRRQDPRKRSERTPGVRTGHGRSHAGALQVTDDVAAGVHAPGLELQGPSPGAHGREGWPECGGSSCTAIGVAVA